MTPSDFEAITDDIAKHTKGSGYSINVSTANHTFKDVAWEHLKSSRGATIRGVIILTPDGDRPQTYLCVAAITSVTLAQVL